MIKKVFILTQFGSPHSWTQQFIDHVQYLGQFGWHWKIFTPNKLESKGNVEVIPMTIEELNELMERKIGVNPKNFILENGTPSKHVSDFYVAAGAIFQDYIQGFDYWGITNWDIVYGRLHHYFPDELLTACDIFSDEINTINGIFSLFKNNDYINNMFREIPEWEKKFTTHQLYGTDEYDMTDVVRKHKDITFIFPQYYPLHGHDRLEHQCPSPKLSLKVDGSLWELSEDVGGPKWVHARPLVGREIPYYHFIRTKKWPNMSL